MPPSPRRASLPNPPVACSPEDAAALPFNFWGGLVGYLGYDLKAECGGGRQQHPAAALVGSAAEAAAAPGLAPDAAFFLADQLLAVDHHQGGWVHSGRGVCAALPWEGAAALCSAGVAACSTASVLA